MLFFIGLTRSYEFDVAISFAGEDRDFARSLALSLEDANYSVFYDEFEASRLWGTELSVSLAEVYGESSRYCIVLISKQYAAKPWTNHERRFAIQRALATRPDYILPIRLDGTELPGWPSTIGYLSKDSMSLAEITGQALAKLGRPQAVRTQSVSSTDRALGEQLLQSSFRRALFTRMESEISLEAMGASLGECIGQIQRLVPQFESPELQNLGIQLLALLDDIQRNCVRSEMAGFTYHLPAETKLEVNGQKLEAIQLLKRLRRRIGASLQFPTGLVYDHFLRADEGRGSPSPHAISYSEELTVQQHLSAVHEHMEHDATLREKERRLKPAAAAGESSPLGDACVLAYEVHLGRKRNVTKSEIEETIMKCIRPHERPIGWVGEVGLTGGTMGPYGDEAKFHDVRVFPSGAMVGMVMCRPGMGREVYAIVFDEKFPEYFGVLRREFAESADAEREVLELDKLDGRGDELAHSVRERGWTPLEIG